MKTQLSIMSGVVAVLVALTATIQAVPITGTVVITGGPTLTLAGAPLGTATGVDATTGSVLTGSGSYAGTDGAAPVTFNGFTIQTGSIAISPLWTFTVGSGVAKVIYSFDLAGMTVNSQNASTLDISGTGTLFITGFDATPGTWNYLISSTEVPGANGVFSYRSSNTAIPDGGMTVMLLGAALSGLYLLKKKTLA